MKLSSLLLTVISVTTTSAWTITWGFTNGQTLESSGTSATKCVNLKDNFADLTLDFYTVDFTTVNSSSIDHVRLWRSRDCDGDPSWDSGMEKRNNLNPNRVIKAYIVD